MAVGAGCRECKSCTCPTQKCTICTFACLDKRSIHWCQTGSTVCGGTVRTSIHGAPPFVTADASQFSHQAGDFEMLLVAPIQHRMPMCHPLSAAAPMC